MIILGLSILFIITFIYILYRNRECFSFENDGIFLTKLEASEFFLKDTDKYVSSMTNADLYARKVKTPQEYIEKCSLNCYDFDDNAKILLNDALKKADKYFYSLSNKYIDNTLIIEIPWKFALSTNEENLPHTREDIIFLTPHSITKPHDDLVKLLIHEKVHLYQRKYIEKYREKLLQNGYVIVREKTAYPLIRANPDVDNFVYKNPQGSIMITLYNSKFPKSILDVTQNSKQEHPFEELAYKIAG